MEDVLEQYFDRLWPICRSITGDGFRDSLRILSELIPLERVEVSSGTKVFDWTVPLEWNVRDAYVEDPYGRKIIDFQQNNLHLLGYSVPFNADVELEELQNHLYSIPDQPDAIPYLTSYYQERWGFCLTHRQREALLPGTYRVVIDTSLEPGNLTYGQHLLTATTPTDDEFILSTYLCHPSMANNELSGPLAMSALYGLLSRMPARRFNYRILVLPETIGAITYLSRNGERLKKHCVGGFVVTCCGLETTVTFKKTRRGNTDLDRCTINALKHAGLDFKVVDFEPTGSDERQYCSPGFNLPVGSIMRGVYAQYPEYHTSLDNKSIFSFRAFRECVEVYYSAIVSLEKNHRYLNLQPYCEPQLGRRGLYPTLGSAKDTKTRVANMMRLLNFSDGETDLCDIADRAGCSVPLIADLAATLEAAGLLKKVSC